LDDDLLAAALSAVEQVERRSRHVRGTPQHPGPQLVPDPGLDDPGLDGLDFEVDLESGDLSPSGLDHDEPDDAAAGHDTVPRSGGSSATASLVRRVAALEDELLQTRDQLESLGERLRGSEVERRRLLGAQRRFEDIVARASAQADQALQARRAAEEQAQAGRRRVEHLEAELVAFRERRRREAEELRQTGHARTVSTLLPVIDNMELAISHASGEAEVVLAGVQMIIQQFHQALQQLGVQRVVAGPGILFDPEVHEALSEILTEEMLPGSIVDELRPGYLINGRLLRAARVTVAARDSAASDGPASDGPASDGPASDGPASDGAASDGPASDGPASDGPASDTSSPPSPADASPTPDGTDEPPQGDDGTEISSGSTDEG